jgi:hypothetical protein
MKLFVLASLSMVSVVVGSSGPAQALVACTPTGMIRDSTNLTAALINPGNVVNQDVDATGCNIGIYYGPDATGLVENSKVHGANYFGIVRAGAVAPITSSQVYDIGETPLAGGQHGIAIYSDSLDETHPSGGDIRSNVVYHYQKSGIVLDGANFGGLHISNNVVLGSGPVNFIAQNGIELTFAADLTIRGNTVQNHIYTGAGQASSSGIVAVGGACFGGALLQHNVLEQNEIKENDVGVFWLNLKGDCTAAPHTATNNVLRENAVKLRLVRNTTGNGSAPYQVAISVAANHDTIKDNEICGSGYNPKNQPPDGIIAALDTAGSSALTLSNNMCHALDPAPAPASKSSIARGSSVVRTANKRISRAR